MLFKNILVYFLVLHLVNPYIQINFHRTDSNNQHENLQHDCLYTSAYIEKASDPYQMIAFCMSELSSKFNIKENNIDQKFTFAQLAKQNVTSQQLYSWSAPIDLIENYQFYLNQIENSANIFTDDGIFYNCTLPYFGPECQYIFSDYQLNSSSLNDIIYDYYYYNTYEPTLLTCYIHLECNRGPYPSCLDWSEICDGKVDCLDGGYDEEYCWQLEFHQCNPNEYQCSNGQCIPKVFFRDDPNNPDCLDISDERFHNIYSSTDPYIPIEPSFRYEDTTCFKDYYHDRYIQPTSSCLAERAMLLFYAMTSMKPTWLSNECWSVMKCILGLPFLYTNFCNNFCSNNLCDEIIQRTCPDIIIVPAIPILFGHVYFAYEKNQTEYSFIDPARPQYLCYNDQLLHLSDDDQILSFFNDTLRCRSTKDISFPNERYTPWYLYIKRAYYLLQPYQLLISNNITTYNTSNLYQCMNSSKYISKSRLYDSVWACFLYDDEGMLISRGNGDRIFLNTNCSTQENLNYFECRTTKECIPGNLEQDKSCDCGSLNNMDYCDDEDLDQSYARNILSFQTICDGFTHLLPYIIENKTHTDETDCEQWPQIHIYNRCNGFWNLPNGSDELNCDPTSLLNCSTNNHICISPETNDLMCLPMEKTNDGIIDCLGAADETTFCQENLYDILSRTFHCNVSGYSACIQARTICDNEQNCDNNEDEKACHSIDYLEVSKYNSICTINYEQVGSDVARILCRQFYFDAKPWRIYFTLDQWQNFINKNIQEENSFKQRFNENNIQSYQSRCHRGLDLQVWLDKQKNLTINVCFCPPSYYGSQCQYQNQRISLTLQFHVTSDSIQIPFIIIVSLIDDSNERIIHSSERLTYLPMINCKRKYNVYLLYSSRPKDLSKEYSIHIDIYEKITLKYRASIIKTLNFPFLPVHRLAYQLLIPYSDGFIQNCQDNQCMHGKCINYFNDLINRTFCQCDQGWSGRYCTIEFNSTCSDKSLSIGKLANNQSLCVCPLDKTGPRCLINDNICQNNKTITCYNNGQCIPVDEYGISTKKFICICSKDFIGDYCELSRTKLILSFDQNIVLPSLLFIHFIEVKINAPPVNTTTLRKLYTGQNSITIYWSLPFHIAFVEFSNQTYYFVVMQKNSNKSITITKTIKSSDYCLNINEILNSIIRQFPPIHRIKYQHLPCQMNSSQLLCFYDEKHLCLCQQVNEQRVANCFEFDHKNTKNLNCSGQSICQHGGQCFQENSNCPRISVCHCPDCYYGGQCQFSTNVFSLSLDAILGYHISPNIQLSRQSYAVLLSLVISLIIVVLGMINGILSLITFKDKTTQVSGCGIYLFSSSIVVLLTMMIFLCKFLILLFSQMRLIKNRLFLTIQCYSIDFLLRSCLNMDQWLITFVGIERAFIIIKKTNFNRKKSITIAKWIIIGLSLLIILTNIHDPIYRSLLDENEDEEQRTWCIVKYPSAVRIINIIINIFHFIIPFITNIITAIIIIIVSTRHELIIHKKKTYKTPRRTFFFMRVICAGLKILSIAQDFLAIDKRRSVCMSHALNT